MAFRPLGFLSHLAAVAMTGISSVFFSSGSNMAPGMEEVISGRAGGGRSYGASRGDRKHKRWKTARASGHHNFRRVLARG